MKYKGSLNLGSAYRWCIGTFYIIKCNHDPLFCPNAPHGPFLVSVRTSMEHKECINMFYGGDKANVTIGLIR